MQVLTFGLLVTAIGIGIVFVGLVILIGLIKLISLATSALARKPKPAAPAPAPATAPAAPVAPAAQPAATPQDDAALIAAITAAITMMLDDGATFVVRKVRRVTNTTPWARAGREEQIYSRF